MNRDRILSLIDKLRTNLCELESEIKCEDDIHTYMYNEYMYDDVLTYFNSNPEDFTVEGAHGTQEENN